MKNDLSTVGIDAVNDRAPALDHAAELLGRVALRRKVVAESLARVARDLAPEFEYFRYARLNENAISSIFAEMLRPDGAHGQGEIFLRLFLDALGLADEFLLKVVRVETEFQANDQRRIDIFLRVDNLVLAIENKPWAGDQDDQLRDYSEFAKSEAPAGLKWRMVYLSNRAPGVNSLRPEERSRMLEHGYLIEIDFQNIASWVESCAREARALRVRVFLEELAQFIRREINGELQMNEAEEIKKIALDSPESVQAAMALNQVIRSVRIELLHRLRDGIHAKLQELGAGLHMVWEANNLESFKAYSGFGFKQHEDQEIYLRFDFDRSGLNGFSWGMRRCDESIADNPARWRSISKMMNAKYGSTKTSRWWPWYSDVPWENFDVEYRDWEWSSKPWMEIRSGLLVDRIVELALAVYEKFEADGIGLLRPGWEQGLKG